MDESRPMVRLPAAVRAMGLDYQATLRRLQRGELDGAKIGSHWFVALQEVEAANAKLGAQRTPAAP